jgi:hypothetical protein
MTLRSVITIAQTILAGRDHDGRKPPPPTVHQGGYSAHLKIDG